MYYALDAAFDDHRSERLREFVSDANPFIWKDKGSADPAVYIEFEQAWDKTFGRREPTAPEARKFVRDYLETQDEGEYSFAPAGGITLAEAFDSAADEETWEEALSEL